MEHPVEADVGCRNTVFHAAAQSAAGRRCLAARGAACGASASSSCARAEDVAPHRGAYRALVAGTSTPSELLRAVRVEGHYGVVRGSLRVLGA
jgi:putative protease